MLPPTWTFLIIICKQLIDTWYLGNNRENIPPLEVLSALHVAHLVTTVNRNSGKLKLRQMRCVMSALEKYANKENSYFSEEDFSTSEYMKRMWGNIGEKYLISKCCG